MVRKGLAVAVIILFLGLSIHPSIAVQSETEINIEPKDYLFQTIIDIANNPDVKKLLERYNHNMFVSDYDYKSIYRQLLLKKPRLLFSMLFTKPSISIEYLDKCYNKGIEITNILGEYKALEIIENVEFTDTKLFDELNNIITKDEVLSGRLETFKEVNKELIYDSPLQDTIICDIGILIVAYLYLRLLLLSMLSNYLEGIFKEIATFIDLIIKIPMFLRFSIFAITGLIVGILGCFGFPPYTIN